MQLPTTDLQPTLPEVRARFTAWRKIRKRGRRIPEELWSEVLEVVTRQTGAVWNEFIDRYHYLGFKTLPGAQLRYFVKADGRILALLGFGAAAWKTAPRDAYIGWDRPTRRKNLHLIVNNARFLILPKMHS